VDTGDFPLRWKMTGRIDSTGVWQGGAAERHPNAQFVAAARAHLARAHLALGDLDAVGEYIAPALAATVTQQRTVPVISRARSLNALLGGHPNLSSRSVAGLRDDLAEFCSTPAASPSELEQGTAG
jgi:hypothetical protein